MEKNYKNKSQKREREKLIPVCMSLLLISRLRLQLDSTKREANTRSEPEVEMSTRDFLDVMRK